jgi:hypothetical protein
LLREDLRWVDQISQSIFLEEEMVAQNPKKRPAADTSIVELNVPIGFLDSNAPGLMEEIKRIFAYNIGGKNEYADYMERLNDSTLLQSTITKFQSSTRPRPKSVRLRDKKRNRKLSELAQSDGSNDVKEDSFVLGPSAYMPLPSCAGQEC